VSSIFDSAKWQHRVIDMAPKRSGQVVILEPEGVEILESYPQMAQRFKDAG
jgi:hypothetical protein